MQDPVPLMALVITLFSLLLTRLKPSQPISSPISTQAYSWSLPMACLTLFLFYPHDLSYPAPAVQPPGHSIRQTPASHPPFPCRKGGEGSGHGSLSPEQVSEMFLIPLPPPQPLHARLEVVTPVKCSLLGWASSGWGRHRDVKGKPFFLEALSYSLL